MSGLETALIMINALQALLLAAIWFELRHKNKYDELKARAKGVAMGQLKDQVIGAIKQVSDGGGI